ncbi:MAG: hypothetical protein WBC98_09780, partial [Candidatus Zixiibacteriota bacterium]
DLRVEGRSLRLEESSCFDLAQHPEFIEGSKGGIFNLSLSQKEREPPLFTYEKRATKIKSPPRLWREGLSILFLVCLPVNIA